MGFCDKEKQLIDGGVTCLDNKFILNYLPDAHDKCVSVYLMGLVVADSDGADNSCQTIANKLGISEEEVMAAFLYWEEMGLVHITNDNPPKVCYLAMHDSATALKKFKPSKYTKFNRDMQNAIEGRMITPNEFNQYYIFLESTTFAPEALVAVAKYCTELKGNDINYHYILTVARNQLHKGATTLETVQDNLNSTQKYDDDLRPVFKALSINRKIDYEDRELYQKWTKEYGFTMDVVVAVAKEQKSKDILKLDAALTEYYKKGALSVVEIEHYRAEKEHLVELAKSINRTIGVYYQSVDMIIDEYLVGWIRRGYNDETLLAIAKYCFRSGIRTLQGLATIIEKLYKNGITSVEALENYLVETSQKDAYIKNVLDMAGMARNVTNNDRTLFKTWTEKWNMPIDVVDYVAQKAAGTTAPMAYINRVLSAYKQKGIYTVEQAESEGRTAATEAKAVVGKEIARNTFTDEQISALFTALDDEEE